MVLPAGTGAWAMPRVVEEPCASLSPCGWGPRGAGHGWAEVTGAEGEQGRVPAPAGRVGPSSACPTSLDILAERVYACGTKPAGVLNFR